MNEHDLVDDESGGTRDDLRQQVSTLLLDRVDSMAADAVAIFPFSGAEPLDAAYCSRVGQVLVRLLAVGVRDGCVDSHAGSVADLHRMGLERALSIERLFTFAYLVERTALDELALNETIGATCEPWPLAAQLVRRASFDVLAAYTEHARLEPNDAAVVDRLTTLYTRPMFEAVLAKEIERASRYGHALSLILFDVDRLSQINQEHGYGVGNKILERLGILVRTYFRQQDWVARHSDDSIAVLLVSADADDATELAEHVRASVEERLGFRDHRDDRPVAVTLSAAVINIPIAAGDVLDPERLMAEAEAAVERAKQLGRNRVERIDHPPTDRNPFTPQLPGFGPPE